MKLHAAGASKSLTKTIREIEDYLQDVKVQIPKGVLRSNLHRKLADLAEKWMKRGFRRGCIELEKEFKVTRRFPKKISYDCSRELFSGQERLIEVKWKSKKS